jgi:hypothetical protein
MLVKCRDKNGFMIFVCDIKKCRLNLAAEEFYYILLSDILACCGTFWHCH